ncbi:chain-length determining protein [Robbsia sp. Bb-Pol-6]|uniref:Chain-length determining protein n=1 Tax=Robbsia betulipollinis TaxID=2981849 RepID=A0ABT3ZK42_9BURK|nr:chain-length determining protein [Robbsia betulipollinis]
MRRAACALRRRWLLALLLAANLLAALYWGLLASDRYLAETHVVVQRTESRPAAADGLLSLMSSGAENRDLLLLRERLLSIDMMRLLDERLALRRHYSDTRRDLLSRHYSATSPDERFYEHYRQRIDVVFDDYAHVLVIKAQAYAPEMAQVIAQTLAAEGERYMNQLDNKLAAEQGAFIERQVASIGARMQAAREALLAFQNANGLVSPTATADSISQLIARLESERGALDASRQTMSLYLTPGAPDMVKIVSQIAALQRQIDIERARLASDKGQRLNRLVERQERLQADAAFAADLYKTALVALERSRIESIRKIKSLSVVQSANLPQSSTHPRRLYNLLVFALVSILIAGVVYLLGAIVREHRN